MIEYERYRNYKFISVLLHVICMLARIRQHLWPITRYPKKLFIVGWANELLPPPRDLCSSHKSWRTIRKVYALFLIVWGSYRSRNTANCNTNKQQSVSRKGSARQSFEKTSWWMASLQVLSIEILLEHLPW